MNPKPKTLLVYPPITSSFHDSLASVVFPIGLAYLAMVLEKNSYTINYGESYFNQKGHELVADYMFRYLKVI
jgi:hypothetical protein